MFLILSLLAWLFCIGFINKKGSIVPKIGGGCFGGGSAPEYQAPAAPKLPTAQDLYSQALSFGQQNMPNALGAREGALTDLQNPTQYYSSFQPTSFEQALGNQQFKNIWPDQQAYMQNILSKSGMAYSPVAAQTLGNAYGTLSSNIGQYLNTQANDRANQSLQARLGIDPMSSILNPYAQVGAGQSQAQAGYDWQSAQGQANANYANALQSYKAQQAQAQMFGQLAGAGAGFLVGGPGGAMLGSKLGGGLTGGSMDLGSAMQGSQGMSFQSPLSGFFGGGAGGGSATSVYGMGGGSGGLAGALGGGGMMGAYGF